MDWKNVLAFTSIVAVSVCFAQDGRSSDDYFNPGIINANLVREMLSGAAERVQQRAVQKNQPANSVFDPLLQNAQALIDQRLDSIGLRSSLNMTALPSIDDDFRALSSLLSSLPQTSPAVAYCRTVLSMAQANIAAARSDDAKRAVLQGAWEKVGQAVFAAERFSSEMTSVAFATTDAAQQWIRERCMKELQAQLSQCSDYARLQEAAELQDAGLSLSFLKPKLIARDLLTATGKLNIGMVSLLRSAFIPARSPLEYEIGMDRVLASMDSSWQPVLDQIVRPTLDNTTSSDLIRADLGLGLGETITDFHSKWVAIDGLLSQLCQRSVGDCFAVAWAIKKHNEYLVQSLKDYGELLKSGYLTRMVDGKPDQFFFLTTLADSDLANTINLSSSGVLGDRGVMVWDAPAIRAACRQMGIDNPQSCAPAAISLLSHGARGTVETTPEEIIKAFAATCQQAGPKLDLQSRIAKGKYGFSLTQSHLLRAWETALAAMAEAKKGDYVRDDVVTSVQSALRNQWAALKASLPGTQQTLAIQLQSGFGETLNVLNRFVYNSSIPLAQVSSDGSSSDGGFTLYRRSIVQPFSIGQRVATPADFTAYLIDVAHIAAANAAPSFTSVNKKAVLDQFINNLTRYMQGNTFLRDVLYAFDDSNKKFPDPVSHYQELSMTPMTSLTGDNPFAVENIDTGVSFLPQMKTLNPQNPYDLIKWILDLAQWKEQTQHYLEDAIANELDPATSPQHAFNIAFEEEDIKTFVRSGQSSDQWLNRQLIQASAPVASAIIDNGTKQSFSRNFVGWLQKNAQLSADAVNALNSSISHLNQMNPAQMTVQNYSSSFFKMLVSMFRLPDSNAKALSVSFDSIFLRCLPPSMVQGLAQKAIRFAKTNWDDGDKNLYFCMFFNPRTAALSFGTIAEDRTELDIMSEYEWVDQQEWEVVPVEMQF